MASVRFIERRGAVLTPSALACLAGVPTVNLSFACAHGCLYSYAQGGKKMLSMPRRFL